MQEVFQSSDCVGLQPNMCAQVYILASLGSREQWSANYEESWMKHCGQSLTPTLAQEWGWKRWRRLWMLQFSHIYADLSGITRGQI